MKRFFGLDELRADALRSPVCTVGVFDGVHRGHRQLLYELRLWANSVDGEACVITFDRHPLELLKGISVPRILSRENEVQELKRHGVDAVATLDFAVVKEFSPEVFLKDVLVGRMGCTRLLLGFDSRVGKGGAGTAANLPAMGERCGVEVRIASPVYDKGGKKIGSSAIRDAIRDGRLPEAANLLGFHHELTEFIPHLFDHRRVDRF